MRQTILLLFLLLSLKSFSQSYVTKQEAVADIDFYNKTILETHYDPFLFIEKSKYFSEVEKIKRNIPDSLSAKQFIILLYQLTALLKDGHCNPNISQPIFKDDFKTEQFFPYSFVSQDDKLYVPISTSINSGIPVGAEIITINNENVSTLFRQTENNISGSKEFKEIISCKLFSYFLFLSDIKPPFDIGYKDSSGSIKHKLIKSGLTFKDALAVTMPHIKAQYDFKILDNKLGCIDFRSMTGDINEFKVFLDSSFSILRRNNIKYAAIDIRKNSGGNSDLGDLLFSYITSKKYSIQGGKKWKISALYKEKLIHDGDTLNAYLKNENGSIWETGNCNPRRNSFETKNKFNGKVYLLTSPLTFSSANLIADGAKNYGLAELVGEPTGENTNDFGEAFIFDLPNSKIKIRTTSSFSYGADCKKNTYAPVIPDVIIVPEFNDKVSERDKTMEYILSKIK